MLKVEINKLTDCKISGPSLIKAVKAAAGQETKIKGGVEINIVEDREMKKINRAYRGRNETTDVLSFAWQEEKEIPGDFLGQIYISYPQIKRQAKEYGVTIKEEMLRMLVHGLLHLVGYDHEKEQQAKKMFNHQEKILNKILSKI